MDGNTGEIVHADGRVELRMRPPSSGALSTTKTSRPSRVAKRTWTTYNYAALWISMAHCIPTYMLASGLMAAG